MSFHTAPKSITCPSAPLLSSIFSKNAGQRELCSQPRGLDWGKRRRSAWRLGVTRARFLRLPGRRSLDAFACFLSLRISSSVRSRILPIPAKLVALLPGEPLVSGAARSAEICEARSATPISTKQQPSASEPPPNNRSSHLPPPQVPMRWLAHPEAPCNCCRFSLS